MRVRVECYAGRKGEEWPLRFWLDERVRVVAEVLEQWYGPEDAFFRVRADDGITYLLRHDTSIEDGEWDLVAFGNSKAG
jgi:hypothetical protein